MPPSSATASGRAQRGQPEAARRPARATARSARRVGAQHVEGAVREVEHAQHAEDQRQARGDEEQEHRGGQAAQRTARRRTKDRASSTENARCPRDRGERQRRRGGSRSRRTLSKRAWLRARIDRGRLVGSIHELASDRRTRLRLHDRERILRVHHGLAVELAAVGLVILVRGSSACRSACRW